MRSIKSILQTSFSLSIFLTLLFALPASSVLAYPIGPNNPASGTNESGIGTETWQDPGNITSPGTPYATVALYHLHLYSNYLKGTQYGFNIPADAIILGIQVDISRATNAHNPSIHDNEVKLVKGGQVVGENRSQYAEWPLTFLNATFGSPSDLWGITWTPDEINAPDFGAVLAAYRDNNGNNAREGWVDTMKITVTYAYSTSTAVDCVGSPVTYGDSVTCVVTVTRIGSDLTPTGAVTWTSDSIGDFDPNPCNLSGADGIATCTLSYTPHEVGSGTHLLTATYNGDAYFIPSSTSQAVNVLPRPVTVTTDPITKVFSQADPELTYQVTTGSLVFNDTFTGILTRVPGENVGTYPILQGSLALPGYYDLTFEGASLTITGSVILFPFIHR